MARYFVQGKGEVRLDKCDFKAQGGEGAIYVKGSTAYKIFSDPQRAITQAKILELSVLSRPNIIRPLDVLLDGKNTPVGYSMRSVARSYALCQLFPKAFRQRNRLTADATLRLVRKLREGVAHVHARSILIVDLNEMNFLVAEDFAEVFFIDVDSYQTPSFPATVLMESVRDRQAQRFTNGSDWFSFAVVSFQMFVGIHPFKGTYAPLQSLPDKESKLDARMRANVSVLSPEVSVPASCLPLSVIPPAYLDWYRAVFEDGRRLPPPENAQHVLTLTTPDAKHRVGSSHFEITEVRQFDGEIIRHDGPIITTQESIYFDGQRIAKPQFDAQVAATPRLRHLVAAFMSASGPRFYDLTDGRGLDFPVGGEEVMLCRGQFYVRQQENIFAVEFIELRSGILLGIKPVANVMMKSTRMFEGLVMQNLLGAYYASIFPSPGVCHQIRLLELDGYQIVDARLERNLLMVVGAKRGRYDKLIFRFVDDFSSYDSRATPDISSTNIDFTVLDSGVVLHITDEDSLEVFSRLKGSSNVKSIQDSSIRGDVRLFHIGAQALIARGSKLYKIGMR
jgi:serine/threonine protein kinase